MTNKHINRYYDQERVAADVQAGRHRGLIGGMWDTIGSLQFSFVRDRGLEPDMRLIDIGCGCLRAGVHFIRHLEPGHYYGIDVSEDLLQAGFDLELPPLGLQERLPRENLAVERDFDATSFGVQFDVALAQSVFTHLPLNHMKLCMRKAATYVKPGGTLYATVFLSPEDHEWSQPLKHATGGVTSHPHQDPFHYQAADLRYAIAGLPWRIEDVTGWNHPRDQTMVIFRRTA